MKNALLCLPLLSLVCASLGCDSGTPTKSHTVPGGPPERIAAVQRIIQQSGPLPGMIREAEIVEQQCGDGRLGPSDFTTFIRIKVDAADISKWKVPLQPAREKKDFVTPREPVRWWVSEEEFHKLELYEPKALFGRTNGWVGFSSDQKTIYVMIYTM